MWLSLLCSRAMFVQVLALYSVTKVFPKRPIDASSILSASSNAGPHRSSGAALLQGACVLGNPEGGSMSGRPTSKDLPRFP